MKFFEIGIIKQHFKYYILECYEKTKTNLLYKYKIEFFEKDEVKKYIKDNNLTINKIWHNNVDVMEKINLLPF